MTYLFPFGETVKRLVQEDRTPKKVLPLAHPRQIGGLGFHSKWWKKVHQGWEDSFK